MRYNTDSFIAKAKEVHGDYYDYSKVEYKSSRTKVELICKKHGRFLIEPAEHLRGKGCAECGKIKRKRLVYGVGINDLFNVVNTNAYKVWKGILERCYSKRYHSIEPTYKGCTVCEEWLLFSTFKQWFDENFKEGLYIDKDILSPIGEKIYSPSTCVFVTREINNMFRQLENVNKGCCFHKKVKKYAVATSFKNKTKHIGYYNTREEAISVYKETINNKIRNIAKESFEKGEINERLYNILINYKFK